MSITVNYSATDYIFNIDSSRPDAVVHQYSGSTIALPKMLTCRRVYPKRTATYIGNARNHMKLVWNVDIDGEAVPIIGELSISRRADMPEASVTLFRGILGNAILDSEVNAFFNTLAMPQ